MINSNLNFKTFFILIEFIAIAVLPVIATGNQEKLKELEPPPEEHNQANKINREPPLPVFSSLERDFGPESFTLSSKAIDNNGELLKQYKCEHKNNGIEKSIPLSWENVPENTKSLAVIMYHYPQENDHSHVNSYLLLWNIDPSVTGIPYGRADKGDWYMGSNKDGNAISYTSPCSHGPGTHKYTIAIFALAEKPVGLPAYSTMDVNYERFMSAIENTAIITKAELNFTDTR